ncbi:MAG: phosphoribosylformylglycinamidine cyclo-ligase [candidate division Zixibacteria bacterium]|nr:phosphoribosylformylglycinamidine cyclo-ligase [candidate division Zixibacteria bacterium]
MSEYKKAGVDIALADAVKNKIKLLVASTRTPAVLADVGAFGGMMSFPKDYKDPVLVATTDGVGTKLKVAIAAKRLDTVGEDLVNHSVNDLLVQGAAPLFFMDYQAWGKLDAALAEVLMEGLVRGCKKHNCPLLGGETAEMPGLYAKGEFDLAGFMVGIVENAKILDGRSISPGDVLVGLASSGLHTNGYSLARKVLLDSGLYRLDSFLPDNGTTLADELLRVHRSYFHLLHPLILQGKLNGLAHITGGAIPGNLIRILPFEASAVVNTASWDVPPIFKMIQKAGEVSKEEMYRVFNMGVGMVAVVGKDKLEDVLRDLKGMNEKFWVVGEIVKGKKEVILQ